MKEDNFIYFYKIKTSINNDIIVNTINEYSVIVVYDRKTSEDLCMLIGLKKKVDILTLKSKKTRPVFIDPIPRVELEIDDLRYPEDNSNHRVPSALRVMPVEKDSRHVVEFAILRHTLTGISPQELHNGLVDNVKEINCYD